MVLPLVGYDRRNDRYSRWIGGSECADLMIEVIEYNTLHRLRSQRNGSRA